MAVTEILVDGVDPNRIIISIIIIIIQDSNTAADHRIDVVTIAIDEAHRIITRVVADTTIIRTIICEKNHVDIGKRVMMSKITTVIDRNVVLDDIIVIMI
jgi:3-hydroxy-3-methylglutaryl CoA synthase